MRSREEVVKAIVDCGIVPVVRASSPEEALQAADALLAGGLSVIEITFTVPGASEVIADLHARLAGQIVLGGGTVLTREHALEAMQAGAEFIVSPNTNPAVIEAVRSQERASIPGAFSPTEVVAAVQAGADMVKIFPANVLGPGYLRDLRGPLPDLKLVPTGGISLENAADYLRAGAAALGVGGNLVDQKALRSGRLEIITENARRFLEIVCQTRREMT